MPFDRVQDVQKFFAELGGLHDAKVLNAAWNPQSYELTVTVDDLRANFAGLPEHGGAQPATLVFRAVSRVNLGADVDMAGGVRIFDVECSSKPGVVRLLLSPYGRIEVEFQSFGLT